MNTAVLSGRLTKAADLRYTQGENPTAVARFTLAVDDYSSTDFISCKALGRQAEWVEKWTNKGTKVELTGKIKTGHYTSREGREVYYTEVLVNGIGFGETKAEAEQRAAGGSSISASPAADSFLRIPDGVEDELPFNERERRASA